MDSVHVLSILNLDPNIALQVTWTGDYTILRLSFLICTVVTIIILLFHRIVVIINELIIFMYTYILLRTVSSM